MCVGVEGRGVVRWQSGKGGRVVRWQVGKGVRVVRWQGGKGGKVLRWQGERFLVLYKGGRYWVSERFNIFVSDVNQWNKAAGWVQDVLGWLQEWKNSLDHMQAVKNRAGCECLEFVIAD